MFTSGFYDSLNGDRKYTSAQMSAIFDGVIMDGVYGNIYELFATIPGDGMQVIVKTGRAWFNHTWSLNDSWMPLDIDVADVLQSRIDAVVLEVNETLEVRENSIKIVKGAPSVNPMKPALVKEGGVYQYALAYVTVAAEATSITEANIEIVVGQDETPLVTSPLKTVPIDDLFNQWNGEFTEWFNNLKAQLSDNVVANLQAQIDNKVDKSDKATASDIKAGTVGKWVDAKSAKEAMELVNTMEIGDITFSTRNLELLTNGKLIACDQRCVDGSELPESLRYRVALEPSNVTDLVRTEGSMRFDLIFGEVDSSDGRYVLFGMGYTSNIGSAYLPYILDRQTNEVSVIDGSSFPICLVGDRLVYTGTSNLYDITSKTSETLVSPYAWNSIYKISNTKYLCVGVAGTTNVPNFRAFVFDSSDKEITEASVAVPNGYTIASNLVASHQLNRRNVLCNTWHPFGGIIQKDANDRYYTVTWARGMSGTSATNDYYLMVFRSMDHGASWSRYYTSPTMNNTGRFIHAFGIEDGILYIIYTTDSASKMCKVNLSNANASIINLDATFSTGSLIDTIIYHKQNSNMILINDAVSTITGNKHAPHSISLETGMVNAVYMDSWMVSPTHALVGYDMSRLINYGDVAFGCFDLSAPSGSSNSIFSNQYLSLFDHEIGMIGYSYRSVAIVDGRVLVRRLPYLPYGVLPNSNSLYVNRFDKFGKLHSGKYITADSNANLAKKGSNPYTDYYQQYCYAEVDLKDVFVPYYEYGFIKVKD